MFKQIWRGILDFALPPVCISCDKPLETGKEFVCNDCYSGLTLFKDEHPWRKTYIARGIIDDSFSLYRFVKDTPIQNMLHSMKYEKMKSIGLIFGKEIAKNLPGEVKVDLIVPVPLHIAKSRERTYNQSEFICRGISKINGAEVLPELIKRRRFTKSQTKLDKFARSDNVRGAFEINEKRKHAAAGKNIILVDDVITTGATILECARVLKENGARYVMACSAAYDAID